MTSPLEEKDKEIQELETLLADAEDKVDSLNAQLASKNKVIVELNRNKAIIYNSMDVLGFNIANERRLIKEHLERIDGLVTSLHMLARRVQNNEDLRTARDPNTID